MDWLQNILAGRRPTKPSEPPARRMPTIDILAAAERGSILAHLLDEQLSQHRLARVTPRSWIDGSAPPARRMFQAPPLKGAVIKFTWGVSLDFVPDIRIDCLKPQSDKPRRSMGTVLFPC